MSTTENKAIVRRVTEEVWNKHNPGAIDEYYAADYATDNPWQRETAGLEAVKQRAAYAFTAFPDVNFAIEDLIAEGDKVVSRWKLQGTHQGDWMGVPPTGKQVTSTGITIYRFAGGKIQGDWQEWDGQTILEQLGVAPASG